MATLLKEDGSRVEVHPANGVFFALRELQGLLGRRLLCGTTRTPRMMIVFVSRRKEEGRRLNASASLTCGDWYGRMVYGDALIGTEVEVSCLEDYTGTDPGTRT